MSRDAGWAGGVFFRGAASRTSRAGVRSGDLSLLGLCKECQLVLLKGCTGQDKNMRNVPWNPVNPCEHSRLRRRDDGVGNLMVFHRHRGARHTNLCQCGDDRAVHVPLPCPDVPFRNTSHHPVGIEGADQDPCLVLSRGLGLARARAHVRAEGVGIGDHDRSTENSQPWLICGDFAHVQQWPCACLLRRHRPQGFGYAYQSVRCYDASVRRGIGLCRHGVAPRSRGRVVSLSARPRPPSREGAACACQTRRVESPPTTQLETLQPLVTEAEPSHRCR